MSFGRRPGEHPRRSASPPLSDTLRLLLPPSNLTPVLRACLLSGPAAADAWELWLRSRAPQSRPPAEDGRPLSRLLPLLTENLRRHGVSVGADWQPYLRIALVHEESRSQRYRRFCKDALGALGEAGVGAILLGGAALAETVYSRPALRHCHDIDVLVHRADLDRALRALTAARFSTQTGPRARSPNAHALRHESGLPLELRLTLFRVPFYDAPVDDVWRRARPTAIMGALMPIMSPADMLVHACGDAATDRSRDTLAWVCDAALLVQRHPDLAWSAVLDLARSGRVALPLWVMLTYLARHLEAAVPTGVLGALREEAMRTDAVRRQSAIAGVHVGARGGLGSLWGASGWRSRLSLVRWALAPSPSFLRWTCDAARNWALPLWYVLRPLRALARRLPVLRRARASALPRA